MSLHVLLNRMADSIEEFEGGEPGDLNIRNNNPGNLKFAKQHGSVGTDPQGHAVFESYEKGRTALVHQIEIAFTNKSRVYNSGMSLAQFFGKYAEDNSNEYAKFVADRLGATSSTTLTQLAMIEAKRGTRIV